MNNTKIDWTDISWNPMHGCTPCSSECDHCYAERMAKRLQGMGCKGYKDGFKVHLNWDDPYLQSNKRFPAWKKVFVCSMGDLFHEDVPNHFIESVLHCIKENPQTIFQILTKRGNRVDKEFTTIFKSYFYNKLKMNLWLGATIGSNDTNLILNAHCIIQSKTIHNFPAKTFISFEPLIEAIELDILDSLIKNTDWVIVGGENGPGAREIPLETTQNIYRLCLKYNKPLFFKGWGDYSRKKYKESKDKNKLFGGKIVQEFPGFLKWKARMLLKNIPTFH